MTDRASDKTEIIETAGQLLIETDWAAEWKRVQRSRKHVDSADRWDRRAPTFGSALEPSDYARQFMESLVLEPGDTVLDMGCGTGALAIPLARAGYHVIARDFSAGMLTRLIEDAETSGTAPLIDIAQLAWEDDWEAAGIGPRSVDVAFASRSVITADLGAALAKLSRTARRRACATVSTGYTPMMSPTILRDLGITRVPAYDFAYTFNILMQQGYAPEVRYIVHDRVIDFNTPEEGVARIAEQLEHAQTYCDADELARAAEALPAWVAAHMVPNERAGQPDKHSGVEGAFVIIVPDDIRWAFVSWDV